MENERPSRSKQPTCQQVDNITSHEHRIDNTVVPFVYMVYQRVEYLQQALESLKQSDFPRSTVPLIISLDGRVPAMVEFVQSLKTSRDFRIYTMIHPHACYDHPTSFPGNDTKLEGRNDWSATCAKHHFAWMLRQVFRLDLSSFGKVEHFMFMEEDYLVAPTIYSTIVQGLNAMEQYDTEFLGLGFDLKPGGQRRNIRGANVMDMFHMSSFVTGPMTLSRQIYKRFVAGMQEFCTFDDVSGLEGLAL